MEIIQETSKTDLSMTMGERVFLLALDRKRGKLFFRSKFALKYAATASIIYELEKKGRIGFENEKLIVKDKNPTGDHIQSMILEKIIEINKNKKLNYWISKLASNYKEIRSHIIEDLLNMSAIRKKRDKNENEIENRYEVWKDSLYRRQKSELDRILFEKKKGDPDAQALAAFVLASRATGNIYREKESRLEAKIQIGIFEDNKYAKNIRKSLNAVRFNFASGTFSLIVPIITKIL